MRPVDPLIVILGCYAILRWRGRAGEEAEFSVASEASSADGKKLAEAVK
jgi:hypothetical protein